MGKKLHVFADFLMPHRTPPHMFLRMHNRATNIFFQSDSIEVFRGALSAKLMVAESKNEWNNLNTAPKWH